MNFVDEFLRGAAMDVPLKRCSRCGFTKPITAFYAAGERRTWRTNRDGLTSACKKCVCAINAAYRQRKRNSLKN